MTNIYRLIKSTDLLLNISRQVTATGEAIDLEEIDLKALPN
jgi:hypothetical protein